MIKNPKTKEELLKELADLKLEYASLKTLYEQDITGRKQMDYQTIIDAAPIMIAYKSKDDHFVNVNSAFAEFVGLSKEEIIGKTTFDIVKQRDVAQRRRDHDLEVMRTGIPVMNQLVKWSGFINEKEIWALYSKLPFHDVDGNVIGTVSFVVDIDDRMHAEEAQMESKERFHSLYENSMLGLYRNTPDGQILLANPALVKMLGYSTFEELAVRNLQKDGFEPSCNRNLFLEQIELNGEVKGLESEWIRKDGEVVYICESSRAFRDSDGKTLYYDGTVEDITERKRTEEALQQSEDRYRDLVENSNDLICTHDLDGNLLSVNNAAINITGYSKEEALKMNMQNIIVPEYRRIFDVYLAKIKAMGHAQGLMIIQTKTGERRIWEYNNTLRTEGIAKPIVRGMVKDITVLKHSEATLKKLNAELTKSNVEKDKFFSIIAHDLKSPFLGFLGLTKNMVEESGSYSSEELAQVGSTMYQAADNLFKLLQNLLEWAQMQSGSIRLIQKNILLSQLITENVETIKNRSEQKRISINNMVTDQIYAYADENMINSVLLNLLLNAVKFTHRNGAITVNAKEIEDQMIEISIKDSGVGMPKRIVERLFELGAKTGRKGTEGELSTGLGLLLCKEFIDKNDGKIWVESEEGKGSTFSFTLQKTGRY